MKYTLIEIVHGLESDFGEEWYKRDDWRGSRWDKRRICWLRESNTEKNKQAERKPSFYYELTNRKTGEKKRYGSFDHLKRDMFGTGKPLHGVVTQVHKIKVSEGPDLLWKYGYLMKKVAPY